MDNPLYTLVWAIDQQEAAEHQVTDLKEPFSSTKVEQQLCLKGVETKNQTQQRRNRPQCYLSNGLGTTNSILIFSLRHLKEILVQSVLQRSCLRNTVEFRLQRHYLYRDNYVCVVGYSLYHPYQVLLENQDMHKVFEQKITGPVIFFTIAF